MQGAALTLAELFSTMCTIAILLDVVPDAPLILAANRDESYARPTRPPALLGPGVVGGIDVLSGGTWLAVRGDGRFAAVTNQRVLVPTPSGLRSRGHVVRELALVDDPAAYIAALDPTHYASMNLVWGDARGAWVAYARRETNELTVEPLPRGVHVLCNDRLGSDAFPRGARLQATIEAAGARSWSGLAPILRAALADHAMVEPDPTHTHLPHDLARALTATCIHSPAYGTRSSSLFAARVGAALAYEHADGPPCTTPFTDLRALLEVSA